MDNDESQSEPVIKAEDWLEFAHQIGLKIQQARHKAGFTQDRAAAEAGISRSSYAMLELGRSRDSGTPSNPSIRTLLQIARALRADVRDLLP